MIKDQIYELLQPFDGEIKQLIDVVLNHEQRFITYEFSKNDNKLKEIKQKIREEIEILSKNGYEA